MNAVKKELFNLQGIDPTDTSNRYFNQYTEECLYCKRRFKSIKWMKAHVANEHQNLINNSSSNSNNKSGNKNDNNFNLQNESSDKIRCIFCPNLYTDSRLLHEHLVSDHRNSLQEMITRDLDKLSNFGESIFENL